MHLLVAFEVLSTWLAKWTKNLDKDRFYQLFWVNAAKAIVGIDDESNDNGSSRKTIDEWD